MTPEHKALVDALTRKAETDGLLSVEDIREVAESLSAQCAQPQAGEPVTEAMVTKALSAFEKDHPHNRAAMREALTAAVGAGTEDQRQFKNFHRLLCERFGYTHDEKDWFRDQVSLIEHIAAIGAGVQALAASGESSR